MADNHCNDACHRAQAPGGDPARLKRQVTRCAAAPGARIAPDEIDAVVTALNLDH